MPFLPPSPTAPAWDFGSAAPSSSHMAAACGRPRILPEVQASTSLYPAKPKPTNNAEHSHHRLMPLSDAFRRWSGSMRIGIPKYDCATLTTLLFSTHGHP